MLGPAPFIGQLVDWKAFERFVYDLFSDDPDLVVEHDVTLEGKSGARRQIDVMFTQKVGALRYQTLVECKRWKDKVTRQRIDVLASAVEDLNAAKGVMFTTSGYEDGAEKYAKHKGIELFTVRDLTDQEWGLPGRVVWFYWHMYTTRIVVQPGRTVIASIVQNVPANLNLELPISPDAVHDPAFTLYSVIDGSPGPNLIALLLEARKRVIDRLSASVRLIDDVEYAARAFAVPVELDMTSFDTRQLLRPFGGIKFETMNLALVVHVDQTRFEHDRGQGLNLALAVENYVTRQRQVVTRPERDGATKVFEVDERRESSEDIPDADDVLQNGALMRIVTEPWVHLPEINVPIEPCKKFTFRLPDWDMSISVPGPVPSSTAPAVTARPLGRTLLGRPRSLARLRRRARQTPLLTWLLPLIPGSRRWLPVQTARLAPTPQIEPRSLPGPTMPGSRSKALVQGLDPWHSILPMTSLQPTGDCWCGCGDKVSRGAFFTSGHDKRAEAAVVKVEYGSVPDLLVQHGYGPGGTKNACVELRKYQQGGGDYL